MISERLKTFISYKVKQYLREADASEYAGYHRAPGNDGSSEPMHDIVDMFPGIYTNTAFRDYGGGYGLDESDVIHQIQSAETRPNKHIVIYRAVPDLNVEVDNKIKKLQKIIGYKIKFGFFPAGDKTVEDFEETVKNNNPSLKYEELKQAVYDGMVNTIENLQKQKKKPLKINNGDWVTTSRMYAKQHGESNLDGKYKIVKKVVKASQLYTDGNSIFEWGYVE